MKLPKRPEQHIVESDSLTVLRNQLPREWVIRELSERDYGVDLYVEIVGANKLLSGNMVAIQLKGTKKVTFRKGRHSFGGIKRETLNYWQSLPVPVFLCVACLDTKKCYWGCIENQNRLGRFKGISKTVSVELTDKFDFSHSGLHDFNLSYAREKFWAEVENAIEKSLMLFNTLGPLVLMCERGKDDAACSTTLQYLVNQHYEHYVLLSKYLLWKRPKPLTYWYEQNDLYIASEKLKSSSTMYNKVLKELFEQSLGDYRDGIILAYEMVVETQAHYFSARFPFLYRHLKARPHTFISDDWYSRYFWDEYENETAYPEKLYFEDFDEFDSHLDQLLRS